MKNWFSSERCGPTTRPPFRTSQFVAMKMTPPVSRPNTRPCTTALSRSTRVKTISSSLSLVATTTSPLEVLEETLEDLAFSPVLARREVQEERGVAQRCHEPSSGEAHGEAIQETENGPLRGHGVAWQILAQQTEPGPDDVARLQHE